MTKDEDFKLLKIQTCVLRVNIHCDGCKQKVKKLLQRIEGVCQVTIDVELQKVTVLGGVDAATLIRKLFRAGKHAEVWAQKSPQNQNQNQNQKGNCIKNDDKNKGQKLQENQMKFLEALKNHQQFPCSLEEGNDYYLMNDDGEENANLLNLIRQQQAIQANNGKMNNGGGGNKKGNQNHNVPINGGKLEAIDPRTLAALKMGNAQLNGGANMNHGDQRMAVNDINSMMNLAGFHANPNSLNGGYQMQTNNGLMGSSSTHHGFPNAGHHHASMMYGGGGYPQQQQFNNPSSVLMNLQNRQTMQQPQMMYNRSPFIPTTTGYCHNYSLSPYAYHGDHSSATHVSSDENTSSCSIM